MEKLHIHPDIHRAQTLPAEFYTSASSWQATLGQIFTNSWHFAGDRSSLPEPGYALPFTLLPECLDEPLLFTTDKENQLHCLSNVCTHRAKVVVEKAGPQRLLSCGYHGRCFSLNGRFRSMPEFEEVADFPSEKDHLTPVPFAEWLGLLFVSLLPRWNFSEMVQPITDRLAYLPLDSLIFQPRLAKKYSVKAHWALYCDNYLEGFHIPFVHPGLNEALETQNYGYELFPWCNLQLGLAKQGEPHFDIPEGHPDYGKKVYAYYWWVFPNLMFNFYPWGLSLNIVQPQGPSQTKVHFRSYVFANTPYSIPQEDIDTTELEDETVVESVQQGIRSRFYQKGRFSPTQESAVHHFHRLIAEQMNQE